MTSIAKRVNLAVLLGVVASPLFAAQWVNPKDVVGDPMKARLQQGRKDLTAREREETQRYGFTGLELMTYLYANKVIAEDTDVIHRCVNYDGITLRATHWLFRRKYNYKDIRDKITYQSVKPGEIEYRMLGYDVDSPKNRNFSTLQVNYARTEKMQKNREGWAYLPKLKRVRKDVPEDRQEEYGSMISTVDDDELREPWEEDHKILGEDTIRGQAALVVESRNRLNPNYYLNKRVVWIEKTNFIDLHEEQFNRQGKIYKVFDLDWIQIRPGNYWVPRETNIVKLPRGERTLHQTPAWIVNQGLTDKDFSHRVLELEKPWRKLDYPFPPVNGLADLPPLPKVRSEFWTGLGIKHDVAG
jgi:hypothetical protein